MPLTSTLVSMAVHERPQTDLATMNFLHLFHKLGKGYCVFAEVGDVRSQNHLIARPFLAPLRHRVISYGTYVSFYENATCEGYSLTYFQSDGEKEAHKNRCNVFGKEIRAQAFWLRELDSEWTCCLPLNIQLHGEIIMLTGMSDRVTVYTDTNCSANATNVPFEECIVTSERQKSYSLVCGDPDDPAAIMTKRIAPSSVQTARLRPLSTSNPAQKSVATPLPIFSQETSTPAQNKNDNDGGLSTSATIAIGVIIPAVRLIVAIVFGVRR